MNNNTLTQAAEILGTYREGVKFIELDENDAFFEVKGHGDWANKIYKINLNLMENYNMVEFECTTVYVQVDEDENTFLVEKSVETFNENLESRRYNNDTVKSYKRESTALKFGQNLANELHASFDGLVLD